MKRQWFLDCYCNRQFAALVEDGKLVEFSSEQIGTGGIVGNIYKGKVVNVLSGMDAAFISCGLERNCYLSMEEVYADTSKYDGETREGMTKADLKVGDEVIVQVVQPPRGNKGAKVTLALSFVGKYLIYLHGTNFVGISRRITDMAEKQRLLNEVDGLRDKKQSEGFIVRTQAPLVGDKVLKKEAEQLKKTCFNMQKIAKDAPIGTLLYKDCDLPVRIIRDTVDGDAVITVGNKWLYEGLMNIERMRGTAKTKKINYHQSERAMYRELGISKLVSETYHSTVPLEGGGYIVIDPTEALTVVDVNTGSFVGQSCLEETVFEVNMRAAVEIARQVRLRNIAGIVVVDFIDMSKDEHRVAVVEKLKEALSADKAKTKVLPMSELGIVEFTRKRVGNDNLSLVVKPCNECKGRGYVLDDLFVITRIREDILDLFAEGYKSVIIELNEGIMQKILKEKLFSMEANGVWKDKLIYMVPHKTYAGNRYEIRGDNASILTVPDKAQLLY